MRMYSSKKYIREGRILGRRVSALQVVLLQVSSAIASIWAAQIAALKLMTV